VGKARIRGRRRILTPRSVAPELDERHELVQGLLLRGPSIESAGQIEGAVLDRKSSVQCLDGGRENGIEPAGQRIGCKRPASGADRDFIDE
jgi:hypothetical protein